jgi:iron-sulfur cluster assembly accessory protein
MELDHVTTSTIVLTDTAINRVQRLLEERNMADHALRVFVSGGGCSGMQYGMAFEDAPRETDHRFSFGGVDVVVDELSIQYLAGATIDYSEEIMGGGFQIDNPNAVSSCGCGHSFKTEGSQAHAHTHTHAGGGCAC